MNNARVLFVSHGGGPLPLLGDQSHSEMLECLETIASTIKPPSSIIVISAHWEETLFTITAGKRPPLIYDYYGFPEAAYRIEYPCAGNPELANRIAGSLRKTGIAAQLDTERGFDHGVFVPLKIMFPNADIPCVQVSLKNTLDPAEHIALGSALREVLSDEVLVVGSGFTFHNMKAFFAENTTETRAKNTEFEAWLANTIADKTLPEAQREQQLLAWSQAPSARYCHPREEHLLPLHDCYGVARAPCTQHYSLEILGKQASMYLW